MGEFKKGEVVVMPFPFSDLSSSKKRPALVVAKLDGDDLILCQITSEARFDAYSLLLQDTDFSSGGVNLISMIRPNKLFTADSSIVEFKVGSLNGDKIKEVERAIMRIILC